MKRLILTGVLGLAAGFTVPLANAQKGKCPIPNTKSLNECRAVIEMIQAPSKGDDPTIAASEELITKYSDSSYKDMALFNEASAYQDKGDQAKAQIFGEQAMKANPKNYQAPNLLGNLIVQQTHEHDLDRDDKLASAEKYFKLGIDNMTAAQKPFEQTPDAQWELIKKHTLAESHNGLGMVALERKNFDAAVAEFKQAVDGAPDEPAYQVRLASAYMQGGKGADAIAVCDKILANPQLNARVRQVAQSIKAQASAKK